MSRYRKLDVRIWGDERVRRLSIPKPNGRDCWVYILTAKETLILPGAIPAGAAALAESLRWPVTGFRAAFAELEREGMAISDWDSGLVWVPKAIQYNPPENTNVTMAWGKSFVELPDCDLRKRIISDVEAFLSTHGKDPASHLKAFRKGFAEGFGNRFETVSKSGAGTGAGAATEPPPPTPPPIAPGRDPVVVDSQKCLAAFNEVRAANGLPPEEACDGFESWCADRGREGLTVHALAVGYADFVPDNTIRAKTRSIAVFIKNCWKTRVRVVAEPPPPSPLQPELDKRLRPIHDEGFTYAAGELRELHPIAIVGDVLQVRAADSFRHAWFRDHYLQHLTSARLELLAQPEAHP